MRLNKFLEGTSQEFNTYLPIQLDGRCNGYQHLTLLANEVDLLESLNLDDKTNKNDPDDFYKDIIQRSVM